MNIEQQLKEIESKIKSIQNMGRIAANRTWIQKFIVPKKNGKRYVYYRVVGSFNGQVKMVEYLGKKNKGPYKKYKEAIARRKIIHSLERRAKKLEKLQKKAMAKVRTNLSIQKFRLEQNGMLLNQLSPKFFPEQVQNIEKDLITFKELIETILKELEIGKEELAKEKIMLELAQLSPLSQVLKLAHSLK